MKLNQFLLVTTILKILKRNPGFTLAELLIALAVLGVIATFTIPKILTANQNAKYKAMTKEAASLMSDAYMAYKKDNTPGLTTSSSSLIPFINYVALITTNIDHVYNNASTIGCGSYCLKLHNGGVISFNSHVFGGTTNTDVIHAYFDPDGVVSSDTSGRSIELMITFPGRVASYGTIQTFCPSWNTPCPRTGDPSADPPWFSWN